MNSQRNNSGDADADLNQISYAQQQLKLLSKQLTVQQ